MNVCINENQSPLKIGSLSVHTFCEANLLLPESFFQDNPQFLCRIFPDDLSTLKTMILPCCFISGSNQKSDGNESGEHRDWGTRGMPCFAKKSPTNRMSRCIVMMQMPVFRLRQNSISRTELLRKNVVELSGSFLLSTSNFLMRIRDVQFIYSQKDDQRDFGFATHLTFFYRPRR